MGKTPYPTPGQSPRTNETRKDIPFGEGLTSIVELARDRPGYCYKIQKNKVL